MTKLSRRSLWRLPLIPALFIPTSSVACSGTGESAVVSRAGDPESPNQLFTRLPGKTTGVEFANRITESRDVNVFTYRNFYNGGGVGIGDLSGDGLPEIVLTSN